MVERKSKRASEKEPAANSTIRDERGRPEVIVEFLFDRGLLHISVNNIGDRPAINVSVKFKEKILGINGTKEISALALFRNIEFLGPRREIVSLLDSSSSYFKRKQPTKIAALVAYSDLEGRTYEVKIKHDLEIYRELAFISLIQSEEKSNQ
jgi:hypothetical protein